MHPLLKSMLQGALGVAVRAGTSALDSVLEDVQQATEEATGRVVQARKTGKRIHEKTNPRRRQRAEPQTIEVEVVESRKVQ